MRPLLKAGFVSGLAALALTLSPPAAAEWSAAGLLDADVDNAKGRAIGEIEDLVVDVDRARVLFAVLEVEGIAELRGKRLAFPIGDFTSAGAGRLVLDIDREKLTQAKAFDNAAWPAWDHPYWGEAAAGGRGLARASALLDAKVFDRAANVVAEIEDFSVEPKSGSVREVVLDLDDSAHTARVPMSALWLDPKTGAPMLGFDAAQLVRGGTALRATRLLGMEVLNRGGETLGEVEDLVADVASGRVAFVVLEYDGRFEPGQRLFAYRLADFAVEDGRRLVLDVDPALLRQARGFEEERWPAWRDEYWSKYQPEPGARSEPGSPVQAPAASASAGASAAAHLLRATELIGKPVRHREGDRAGRIADLIVDTQKAAVTDAIIDVRNSPREARLALNAFSIDLRTGELTLNVERAQLLMSPFLSGRTCSTCVQRRLASVGVLRHNVAAVGSERLADEQIAAGLARQEQRARRDFLGLPETVLARGIASTLAHSFGRLGCRS